MQRHLITTANVSTWEVDKPTVFLNEFCCRYDKKELWQHMDYIVCKPFGIAPDAKEKNFAFVKSVTDELIVEISELLNQYHKTSHDVRYWQIILGHWLFRYVSVIFNRYHALENCILNYNIASTTFFKADSYQLVTSDSDTFVWACNDEIWNSVLFSKIIDYFHNINFSINYCALEDLKGFKKKCEVQSISWQVKIKLFFKNLINPIFNFFSRKSDALIINSYLPWKKEALLKISLCQVPIIWQTPNHNLINANIEQRNQINKNYYKSNYSGFEYCVRDLLMELIPTCFLEGYSSTIEQVNKLPWPTTPKFIFTSNNFDTDEIFKVYTAERVKHMTPYYIGQHGNDYGTFKFEYCENQCIETSDKFFTWGWGSRKSTCIPAFNFKTSGLKPIPYNKKGGAVLVEVTIPHNIYPWDVNSEYQQYQDNQFIFVKALPGRIHQDLIVRLHGEWKSKNGFEDILWKDRSPSSKLDYGFSNLSDLISKCRIVIYSYDSTGILEYLNLNFPVIGFWSGELNNIRECAKPYYEKLNQAGIIFYSPEAAAQKISEIWDDVLKWWNSDLVQKARIEFCDQYSRKEEQPINFLKKKLSNK